MTSQTDESTVPVREGKRQAVLDAGRKVFLESGYGAASMDAIAQEAGVSKQTVYNHFRSKDELFEAVIRGGCNQMVGDLLREDSVNAAPEQVLRDVGTRFVHKMYSESSLNLYRTIMAEVPRFPQLGEIFYRSGPGLAVSTLAEYLQEQNRRGTLHVAEPGIVAEQFFGMLSQMRTRGVLGLGTPTEKELRAQVDQAVHMLIAACRP